MKPSRFTEEQIIGSAGANRRRNQHCGYLNLKRNHICISFGNGHGQWQCEHWRYHDCTCERAIDAYDSYGDCNELRWRVDPGQLQ